MRLINTRTLEVIEFFGEKIPRYAILSHTWGKGELTLQEMQSRTPQTTAKAGYQKIKAAATQALGDSYEWIWIDTCCIDKTSSAELSEAINSMYQYYMESAVCYAYLSDFSQLRPDFKFGDSRWFTRGWTLQELIAPSKVIFFDVNWMCVGDTTEGQILSEILSVTNIPAECLSGVQKPNEFSIARRMSWAAQRECTRIEDIAYSLMGLFDVNMPLLYGEGKKAFTRLQEEILKDTDDQTILAWTVPADSERSFNTVGILAETPADFASSASLIQVFPELSKPSTMTNLGLSVHLPLMTRDYSALSHLCRGFLTTETEVVSAILNCGRSPTDLVIIRLLRVKPRGLAGSAGSKIYHRLGMSRLDFIDTSKKYNAERGDIFIAKKLQIGAHHAPFDHGGIHLQNLPLSPELGARDTADPLYGYVVKSIVGPWSVQSSPQRKANWSSLYGCVFFQTSDLGLYNDPLHINFESPMRAPFHLSIGYSDNWVQLSAVLGSCTDVPPQGQRPPNMEIYLAERQSYRERYGTLITTQLQVGTDVFVTASLHREDPRTSEGEAAGNRPHFLVFVEIAAPPPSPTRSQPQITHAVYAPQLHQAPVQIPQQFRNPEMNKKGFKSMGKMFTFKRNDSAP
ncbi:HET-domain-containing protein [Apiospora arundinis]